MSIINQHTICNAPNVYNKRGVYNTRGVYNDGSGGIDSVDIGGKIYPVVKIGDLYWLAQNLDYCDENIKLGDTPTFDYDLPHAWYYQNDEYEFGWNGKKFGLLYNNLAAEYLESEKNRILNGFRVPNEDDFQNLENSIGTYNFIYKLKSEQYWQTPGINENGFNMVPGGSCSGDNITPIVWSDVYNQSNIRMITSDHQGKQFRANNDNSYILLRAANISFGISMRLCRDA